MKTYPTLRGLVAAAALASLASVGFAQDSLYDTPPSDPSLTSPGAQDVQPYQIAPSMSDTDTMNSSSRPLGAQGPVRTDSAETNPYNQAQGHFSGGPASDRGFAAFLQYQANSTNSP